MESITKDTNSSLQTIITKHNKAIAYYRGLVGRQHTFIKAQSDAIKDLQVIINDLRDLLEYQEETISRFEADI